MNKIEVVEAARSLRESPYVHQGRDPESGIDCLGLLIVTAKKVNYLNSDFEYNTYHTGPDGVILLQEMRKYFDEIPVKDHKEADVVMIRFPSDVHPRHVGILAKGKNEMMLIHALRVKSLGRVVEQPFRKWEKYVTNVFEFRGIED